MKKVFLLFIVSLCFGMIGVVSWTSPAHAIGFPGPPQPTCQEQLNACNAELGDTFLDLIICNGELAACQADDQVDGCSMFPGDGYPNPDAFGVSGHGPALSYTDNGNGTFTDNRTGCMWEIKDNSGGIH